MRFLQLWIRSKEVLFEHRSDHVYVEVELYDDVAAEVEVLLSVLFSSAFNRKTTNNMSAAGSFSDSRRSKTCSPARGLYGVSRPCKELWQPHTLGCASQFGCIG